MYFNFFFAFFRIQIANRFTKYHCGLKIGKSKYILDELKTLSHATQCKLKCGRFWNKIWFFGALCFWFLPRHCLITMSSRASERNFLYNLYEITWMPTEAQQLCLTVFCAISANTHILNLWFCQLMGLMQGQDLVMRWQQPVGKAVWSCDRKLLITFFKIGYYRLRAFWKGNVAITVT